ncbi:TPA: hypothetical protein ACK3JW_000847 [Mannheimia haemolytica]
MLKEVISLSTLATLLSACSFNSNPALEFLPYQEIDGKVEKIRFMQTVSNSSEEAVKGSAYQQSFFGEVPTSKEIGNIYHIYDANGQPMNVIFLMNEKTSINPKNEEQIKTLAKANKFDFYEFGKGRIAHAQFSGKKSICQDFKSKYGIALKIATSYYLTPNQPNEFYASLISAHLKSNSEVTNFSYVPKYQINDTKVLNEVKMQEKNHGEKVAHLNLQEKYSLLKNIICNVN